MSPVTNNLWFNETSVANLSAGNAPPTIALDGILEFEKLLNAKLPEIEISFTFNLLAMVTFPPTLIALLKDASKFTTILFLNSAFLVTNSLLFA